MVKNSEKTRQALAVEEIERQTAVAHDVAGAAGSTSVSPGTAEERSGSSATHEEISISDLVKV
jgi:hypothetical protein